MIKSQILAGGRGLGKFKNGFQGGVHIVKVDKAVETAKKMLGEVLVTKQTGPAGVRLLQLQLAQGIKEQQLTEMSQLAGKPVGTLFVAKKMDLAREMYFAILLDRASAQVMLIGCGEGEL